MSFTVTIASEEASCVSGEGSAGNGGGGGWAAPASPPWGAGPGGGPAGVLRGGRGVGWEGRGVGVGVLDVLLLGGRLGGRPGGVAVAAAAGRRRRRGRCRGVVVAGTSGEQGTAEGGGEKNSWNGEERTAAHTRSLTARPLLQSTTRRHVLFLPPPANYEPPSSSGPGRRPFKAVARVRTPLGARTTAPHVPPARPCSAVG